MKAHLKSGLLATASCAALVGFVAGASANDKLIELSKSDDNWVMTGKNYDSNNYSPLKQINKDNVKKLKAAWSFSTGLLHGHEGTPRVVNGVMYINSSFPNTMSAVHMALAYLIDPRTPKNEGTFRPVTVKARQGTVVWPYPPAPVTLATNHCAQEIAEAVIKALAKSCPDRVLAGWSRRFRIAISGVNPRTRRPFIWHLFHARGGGGACAAGDGWETAGEGQAAGGIKFGSIEVAETRFPLFFARHEFRPDSAGDGQHRGGVGSLLTLRVETSAEGRANTAGDGVRHPSYGILGGKDGLPHRYRVVAKGKTRFLKTKEVGVPVLPGATFVVESAGGGGYGDPRRRDTAARARDRENGLVTSANGRANSKNGRANSKDAQPPYRGRRSRRPSIRSAAKNGRGGKT